MTDTVLAWLLGVAAIATALIAIGTVGHRMWKVIGWHGTFWAWLARFVATVDVIQELPTTLVVIQENQMVMQTSQAAAKAELAAHIEATRVGTAEWSQMRNGLVTLLEQQKVVLKVAQDVRYEVKNNGGSSTRDAVDRIELGVAGLYAQPGEVGAPGREDHRES